MYSFTSPPHCQNKPNFFPISVTSKQCSSHKTVGIQFSLKYWLSILCFCTLEELFLYALRTKSNKQASQTKWEHQCFWKKFYLTLLREDRWDKQTQLGQEKNARPSNWLGRKWGNKEIKWLSHRLQGVGNRVANKTHISDSQSLSPLLDTVH